MDIDKKESERASKFRIVINELALAARSWSTKAPSIDKT